MLLLANPIINNKFYIHILKNDSTKFEVDYE